MTVVHGGGKQMTRFLEERGIKSTFVRGLRVTTAETIDAVLKVLAGSVNTQLVAALGAAGARAVGLTGIDSGIAVADQLDPELGFVGRVKSSDPALLETLTTRRLSAGSCLCGRRRRRPGLQREWRFHGGRRGLGLERRSPALPYRRARRAGRIENDSSPR